ncbi:uncharacterized protein LOC126837617 [Adelges cooleyi]|uniref:uncharacterized protein LOC126837617 n=1 Tax=Adelges cooleyi TaxID=133065 RepID=UPI00217F3DAB|nr:uncharacterized protein LOC126837617 [Adelges cooleyi]
MHTGQPEASGLDAPEGKTEPEASSSAIPEEKINVTPKDLAIIKEAFEVIRKEMSKVYNLRFIVEAIGYIDYYEYMGDNFEEWDFINSYYKIQHSSEYYSITPDIFRDLFIIHCEKSGMPVAKVAEQRKAAMVGKEGRFTLNEKLSDYIYQKRKQKKVQAEISKKVSF